MPGHLALWAGAVGGLIPAPMVITSMLLALYFNVVGFILDPHYFLGLTCISVMHDVFKEG